MFNIVALPSADDESFPEALKRARNRVGISQWDLANAIGCHPRTISAWENGERAPNQQFWDKLYNTLNRLVINACRPTALPKKETLPPDPLQQATLDQLLAEVKRRGYNVIYNIVITSKT